MELHIILVIILQKLELIDIIIYLQKKHWLFIMFVLFLKSIVNKNKSKYYYDISSEKGSNEDKSNTQFFQMNVCIL